MCTSVGISNRLRTPCHTRLRRPPGGPFSYQGVSTRGVRHSPFFFLTPFGFLGPGSVGSWEFVFGLFFQLWGPKGPNDPCKSFRKFPISREGPNGVSTKGVSMKRSNSPVLRHFIQQFIRDIFRNRLIMVSKRTSIVSKNDASLLSTQKKYTYH